MSFFRKLGRAIDPTNKNAPLGGLVRTGISSLPGGAAVLGGVDTLNAAKRAAQPGAGSPTVAATPTGAPPAPRAPLDTKTMAIVGAAAVVVLVLVLRK